MKQVIASFAVLLLLVFMTSAVASGVMRVLGDIVNGFGLNDEVSAWLVCITLAIAAALLFLDGSIRFSMKLLSRIGG